MHAYSTASSRAPAYAAIAVAAVVVAIAADALSGLLYRLVDTRGWRWTALRQVGLIDTPVIAGVYEDTLRSIWGSVTEIPIRLTISQRWTRLLVQMERTDKDASRSVSVAAALALRGDKDAHLTYTYKNSARHGIADVDMSDHDGTADLDIRVPAGDVCRHLLQRAASQRDHDAASRLTGRLRCSRSAARASDDARDASAGTIRQSEGAKS